MVVKTKYNPGDIVFFLHDSKVKQEKIHHVNVRITEEYRGNSPALVTSIRYFFGWDDNTATSKSENEVFVSLATLKRNMIVNKPK